MKQYIINAFTNQLFSGNPAAVCLLEQWPDDEELLYNIAAENALHATAFVVPGHEGYQMRWLTNRHIEINLCGHATLAAAYVLNQFVCPEQETMVFHTMSGQLTVNKRNHLFEMSFPAYTLKELEITDLMEQALKLRPLYACRGRDLLCVLEREEDVMNLKPDLELVKQLPGSLLHVTAQSGKYDCISRTFGPKVNMPEDPVCGSGHCHIVPYWSGKLKKSNLVARQASKRGGTLYCQMIEDRVILAGQAVLYAKCELADF